MDNSAERIPIKDPLTNVYSRALLEERVNEEMKRWERTRTPFSLLLMDIDHFKSINDGFGHARGDEVLIEFCRRLEKIARETDLIFRYGGDEFVILLPQTEKLVAATLAQRLLDGMRGSSFSGKPPLTITMSMGVSTFPEDGTTIKALFSIADQRHYQAKRAGRARVCSEDSTNIAIPETIEEPSRLLERDQPLEELKQFFRTLPNHQRGILEITGEQGTGRSRFLKEICDTAGLQSYIVWKIQGMPALHNRPFGALIEALFDLEEIHFMSEHSLIPHPAVNNERFLQAVDAYLSGKDYAGLLIAIDNIEHLDEATIHLLQYIFSHDAGLQTGDKKAPIIALTYSLDTEKTSRDELPKATYFENVNLKPLSVFSIQIWLRHSLQWEAPKTFLDWFYSETQGLPALIQRGLEFLVYDNVLKMGTSGWTFPEDLKSIQLSKQLAFQEAPLFNNLPDGLTDFIGRENELRQVRTLLHEHRLVTVVGAGGLGKTRLAVQVAAENLSLYKDGVCYVLLLAVETHELIIPTIANALGLSFSGTEDPKNQLINYLNNKSMLLILDNFEHLLSSASLITDILAQAPQIRFLVSSSNRLDLPNEKIFELSGLEIPPENCIDDIEAYSAAHLFIYSAHRNNPDFSVEEVEVRQAIVNICHMVEGVPLGIELAAAWVQLFTCSEICMQIQNSLGFLSTKLPGSADQQSSLVAVLDSFWTLLFKHEQTILCRLSVFQNGFTHKAAAHIAEASPFFLDALMSKYYLRRISGNRYQMHEILRRYSREKLIVDIEEHVQTNDRHCEYYTSILKEYLPHLTGDGQHKTLEDINRDIENIRAAWKWAVKRHRIPAVEEALDTLFYFYYMRSWFKEGEEVFQILIDLWQPGTAIEKSIIGKTLTCKGWFAFLLGKQTEAKDLLAQSLEILRTLGEKRTIAFCLNYTGAVLLHLGEYEKARQALEESYLICFSIEDIFGQSIALNILGQVDMVQGDYTQAQNHFTNAVDLKREIGDQFGMAFTLEYLGQLAHLQENNIDAKLLFQESLVVRREIGDQRGVGLMLNALGDLELLLGDIGEAKKLFNEALLVFQSLGNQLGIIQTTNCLGYAAYGADDLNQAREFYVNALRRSVQIKAIPNTLESLTGYAGVLGKLSKTEAALKILAVTLAHPSETQKDKVLAQRLQIEFSNEMTDVVLQTIQMDGIEMGMDYIATQILAGSYGN